MVVHMRTINTCNNVNHNDTLIKVRRDNGGDYLIALTFAITKQTTTLVLLRRNGYLDAKVGITRRRGLSVKETPEVAIAAPTNVVFVFPSINRTIVPSISNQFDEQLMGP